MPLTSTPPYTEFLPLSGQAEMLYDVKNHDYSTGLFEFMLSGSVGSAKSTPIAWLGLDHVLSFPNANLGIGRLALPRLKETLGQKLREMLVGTGITYSYDETKGSFKFPNGSRITPFSWNDKKYEKFRSYDLSAMIFEELAENHGEHQRAYLEAAGRVGRATHVPEAWIGCATNPDDPSHWVYEYYIEGQKENRRVYYSLTSDNPYLPDNYIDTLMEIYDGKMIDRMLFGKWVSIATDTIYYTYDSEQDYMRDTTYKVDENYPVYIGFDFNIGRGKPFSVCFHQCIKGHYHIFNEVVIHGQRTLDAMNEMNSRGLLDYDTNYIIHGDATGFNRTTNFVDTDYDIIDDFCADKGIRYDLQIGKKNPNLRERHNTVNGVICNAKGHRRMSVYKEASTVDKGLRLTSLVKGSKYLEDDSLDAQHITTGLGYSICEIEDRRKSQGSFSGMISPRGGRRL